MHSRRAAIEEVPAAGPSCRPADPWRQVLGGLQRNCQQFGSNLAHLQRAITRHLPQDSPPASSQLAQPTAAAASLPWASVGQAAAGWARSPSPGAVSREEVGRATWTFLHTLAAQYPEQPTRQQQRDARNLVDILTRMYPCGECARHFKEVVKHNPPAVATRHDFALWMCEVHNVVNRRLGKPSFNCALVQSRWSGLECGTDEEGHEACSLEVGRRRQ